MDDPKAINFVEDEENSKKKDSNIYCSKSKLAIGFFVTLLLGFIIAFIIFFFLFKSSNDTKEVVDNNNNENKNDNNNDKIKDKEIEKEKENEKEIEVEEEEKEEEKKKEEKEEEKEEEIIDEDNTGLPQLGTIDCIYNIIDISQGTQLLGANFLKTFNMDMTIDGKKVNYLKKYKFESTGEHQVQFIIYKNFQMNNMFKDVSTLTSVEMKSDKNCEIRSMIGTFQNCENLKNIEIN